MHAATRPAALLAALAALATAPLAGQDESYPYGEAAAGAYADERADAESDSRESYSFVRALEGRASLASYGNGPGEEAVQNQILQQGDRLRVERGGRLEVYLADRNLVRLSGDTDLTLARVAFSADRDDRTTRLDLDRGEIVLVVTDDALGDELPEIATPAARVYVNEPGTYRLRADETYTEVVVRSGYAEILTESGSTVVRAGEEAWTSGDRYRPVEVASAGPRDALERWGEELTERAQIARERVPYVEPELAYAAAPLADYGSWVFADSAWYWRPRVEFGWRPYYQGRWCWSPSGMTWVSYEPWGWVPYHYGTWCNLPGYGWAWRPGYVYSPAWVYWYCSDSWTGWCPIGYYTNYYRSHWSFGFRSGIYGWCGGSWSFYRDWNFCQTRRICDRRWDGRWENGDTLGRSAETPRPRGILTTDTRGPRDRWDRPAELVMHLDRQGRAARRGGELPQVTDFVARARELPSTVAAVVRPDPIERPGRRAGTPLDPGNVVPRGNGDRGRSDVAKSELPGWRGGPRTDSPSVARRGEERGRPSDSARGGGRGPDGAAGGSRGDDARIGAPGRGRSQESPGQTRSYEIPERPRASTPPAPGDRQGWKSSGGGRAVEAPRELPPPGTRWQQPERGRSEIAPRPPSNDRGQAAPPSRGGRDGYDARGGSSAPPVRDRAPANGGSYEVTKPRYGYPARELGAPPSSPPPSRSGSYAQPAPRSGEPVERVIGGLRRGEPPPSPRPAPPSGGPGYGYPQAPRGYAPPAAPPSAYGGVPRTAPAPPRASVPATPRGTPPAGYGSPAPPAPGSQRATPPPQGGGQKASPPARGTSSQSSSQSSPPPRSRERRHDGD